MIIVLIIILSTLCAPSMDRQLEQEEPLVNSLMDGIRAKNFSCLGASRRLHAIAIQRAEQHRQGEFFAEPLRAVFLRAICCVEPFAKVYTFAAGFALHLISQKRQCCHHGIN